MMTLSWGVWMLLKAEGGECWLILLQHKDTTLLVRPVPSRAFLKDNAYLSISFTRPRS